MTGVRGFAEQASSVATNHVLAQEHMGQEKWAHVNFGVRFHPLSLQQEKSLLTSTKVDAKDKMLLQKIFFEINRVA